MSLIAVSGLDMAAWDRAGAAAKPAARRTAWRIVRRGPAYNSNGLWLTDVAALADEAEALVAEGKFAD